MGMEVSSQTTKSLDQIYETKRSFKINRKGKSQRGDFGNDMFIVIIPLLILENLSQDDHRKALVPKFD